MMLVLHVYTGLVALAYLLMRMLLLVSLLGILSVQLMPALQYVPTMQLIETPKKHVRQAEQFLPQQYVEECRVDMMLRRSEEFCSDLQGVGLPLPRCCPSGRLPFRTARIRLLLRRRPQPEYRPRWCLRPFIECREVPVDKIIVEAMWMQRVGSIMLAPYVV